MKLGVNGLRILIINDALLKRILVDKLKIKKFWEELISYFPLIRHGLRIKRHVQQLSYCCEFILCRGNGSTEPFPSNDRGIYIQTHRVMGGMVQILKSW
jgi:hypothetical protein